MVVNIIFSLNLHSHWFLSHACGGEHVKEHYNTLYFFLSHACGGEPDVGGCGVFDDFLSHACGGEPID